MNNYAKLYDNNSKLLMGLVDMFKGENYCRSQWLEYKIKEVGRYKANRELKLRLFWEG